jgi:hypothetical protein
MTADAINNVQAQSTHMAPLAGVARPGILFALRPRAANVICNELEHGGRVMEPLVHNAGDTLIAAKPAATDGEGSGEQAPFTGSRGHATCAAIPRHASGSVSISSTARRTTVPQGDGYKAERLLKEGCRGSRV